MSVALKIGARKGCWQPGYMEEPITNLCWQDAMLNRAVVEVHGVYEYEKVHDLKSGAFFGANLTGVEMVEGMPDTVRTSA